MATRTLAGDGRLHKDPALELIENDADTDDLDLKVDAVDFGDDCGRYYATPFALRWDLLEQVEASLSAA